jgi:hypothetical protein
MRSFLRSAALAALVLFGAARVQADTVYHVTGTFGPDLRGDSGLTGGSFTATVDVVEPVTGALDSYTVSVFAAGGGTPVYTFSDPTGSDGFIQDFGSGGIGVFLPDPTNNSDAELLLNFAPGFTGTGPVVPTNLSSQFPSLYIDPNSNFVSIASGYSTAAVPEPSSLILAGFAAIGGLGLWARRHRASRR